MQFIDPGDTGRPSNSTALPCNQPNLAGPRYCGGGLDADELQTPEKTWSVLYIVTGRSAPVEEVVRSGLSTIRSLRSTVPRNLDLWMSHRRERNCTGTHMSFLVALVANSALAYRQRVGASRVGEAVPSII